MLWAKRHPFNHNPEEVLPKAPGRPTFAHVSRFVDLRLRRLESGVLAFPPIFLCAARQGYFLREHRIHVDWHPYQNFDTGGGGETMARLVAIADSTLFEFYGKRKGDRFDSEYRLNKINLSPNAMPSYSQNPHKDFPFLEGTRVAITFSEYLKVKEHS